MSPILLRLLLCLCLLLDAVVPAVAATRMATSIAGAERDAPAADRDAPSDCHTMRDPAPVREAPPAQDDDDCLQLCLDLCLQHGFAVLAPPPRLPSAGHEAAPARTVAAQVRAAHALPPLRPPIA